MYKSKVNISNLFTFCNFMPFQILFYYFYSEKATETVPFNDILLVEYCAKPQKGNSINVNYRSAYHQSPPFR